VTPRPSGARTIQAGRVTPAAGRRRRDLPRRGVRDDLPVAHRVVANGQLQHPQEHQSATARAAAVEPEAELVQVTSQVLGIHGALVGGQQPALGQRRDPVHTGQQLVDVLAQGLGGTLAARSWV